MSTKHTPGPWEPGYRAMRTPDARKWYAAQHVFNKAPFEGVLENEWGVYPPSGEAGPVCIASGEANALLISAAPDLLAAAQRAEEWISGFDDDNPHEDIRGMLRDLRAALAKAQGEAP